MAQNEGWRARIEALHESAFPMAHPTKGHVMFADKAEMLAAFAWFSKFGAGTYPKQLDNIELATAVVSVVALQWKWRKVEVEKMAVARAAKLAPLQAARERRKAEKAAQRLAARKHTIEALRVDVRETMATILALLEPGFGAVDWEKVAPHTAHLGSIQTRLRFQINSHRGAQLRKVSA